MRKNNPKRHHYNPQLLLRRFCDEKGKLYFFDKRFSSRGILRASPRDLFVEKHLYSSINADGSRDARLENQFCELESATNLIIRKIIDASCAGKTPRLTSTEKWTWDNFVYKQWTRVPERHAESLEYFDEAFEKSIDEFERRIRPLTPAERASLQEPKVIARIKQNARVDSLASPSGLAVQALNSRGLVVVHIAQPKRSFITGSFSVIKLTYPDRSALTDPTVEVWLPISSQTAICSAGSAGEERLIQSVEDRHIKAINEAIFKQSTVIASHSLKLIQSLTKSHDPTR